jgi:hypothetical protein
MNELSIVLLSPIDKSFRLENWDPAAGRDSETDLPLAVFHRFLSTISIYRPGRKINRSIIAANSARSIAGQRAVPCTMHALMY